MFFLVFFSRISCHLFRCCMVFSVSFGVIVIVTIYRISNFNMIMYLFKRSHSLLEIPNIRKLNCQLYPRLSAAISSSSLNDSKRKRKQRRSFQASSLASTPTSYPNPQTAPLRRNTPRIPLLSRPLPAQLAFPIAHLFAMGSPL